jgi:hypothetical protein
MIVELPSEVQPQPRSGFSFVLVVVLPLVFESPIEDDEEEGEDVSSAPKTLRNKTSNGGTTM